MGRDSDERPLWWKLQLNPQSRLNPHILFNIETYLNFNIKMWEFISELCRSCSYVQEQEDVFEFFLEDTQARGFSTKYVNMNQDS